jgi:hypothetical protein
MYGYRVRRMVALTTLLSGCVDPDPVSLVDHSLWSEVGAADDPWDDRPDPVDCSPLGWYPEDFGGEASLQILTGLCNYLTLEQPSAVAIAEGDLLHLRLVHFDLYATQRYWRPYAPEAHVALTVDDQLVWEHRIPIPATADVYRPYVSAPFAAPEGAPVRFHLHNHGANTWNFIEASVDPDGVIPGEE